jgi:hypothetical protein
MRSPSHVDEHPTQRHRPPHGIGDLPRDVEIGRISYETLRKGHFGSPGVPRLGDQRLIWGGTVEIPVGIGFRREVGWGVLSGHHPPEPSALHVAQVTHQPEQRKRGRLHRPASQVGGTESRALELECVPLPGQEPL